MASMALAYAVKVFYNVYSWFGVVLNVTGTRNIYITFVAIAIIYRLLIAPLVGATINSGISDVVQGPRPPHPSRPARSKTKEK